MLSDIQEAFARLSMLEFVLEIVMANQLAQADEGHSTKAKQDLVAAMATPYTLANLEQVERSGGEFIALRAAEMAKRFAEKVAAREREIRDEILARG